MGAGASIGAQSDIITWISRIPCFATLTPSHLQSLATKVEVLNFSKGEHLINEGQVGSLFGILVQGTLQISARGPNGTEVVLCNQDRGFYFGEAAIIGNTTTTASITAVDDCTIYALKSARLQSLTVEMPEVKESLLQTVSYRLKQNLLAIPFFAQLKKILENKKTFKVLGAFDLLSTLFELENLGNKQTLFKEGDSADKFYVICEGCIRISCHDADGNDFMLGMLKKNDVFGEIGLIEHTKRTATARSFEPSLLLSITKEKFDKLFEVFPEFRAVMEPVLAHRTAVTLKRFAVFDKLSKDKLELLGGLMTFVDFEPGETIQKEGAFDASLYIVVSGTVHALTKHKSTGKEMKLSEVEEGQVMGEIALLGGIPRSATLRAITPCQCLQLRAEHYRRFISLCPEVMDSLIATARSRRKRSIEVDAEASLIIPDIDSDVENKLYLYSLMRNKDGEEAVVMEETMTPTKNVSTKEELEAANEHLMSLNDSKRMRVAELKEKIRNLTEQLDPTKVDVKNAKVAGYDGKGGRGEEKINVDPASPSAKGGFDPRLERRNSWTSNTAVAQYREDIIRILDDTFEQKAKNSLDNKKKGDARARAASSGLGGGQEGQATNRDHQLGYGRGRGAQGGQSDRQVRKTGERALGFVYVKIVKF
ncbi:hypothetical protein TL16_g01772 [Triparma laevis f. inornata]|uniref:Cyclic nucleotide-binding domain-containing protein n=1 Tax=Triparma laevis f. inornata TaxID=1714386 RepID=A0A9W7DU10_9STRA|nr:hypothetical protein TL16_g01772 [Triparma laevis f. inornata]